MNESPSLVYLDHLLPRVSTQLPFPAQTSGSAPTVRFNDLRGDWYFRLCQPQWKHAAAQWTVDDCLGFLESVMQRRMIPSVLLWDDPVRRLIFVLDGSHRIALLRAWMTDQWSPFRKPEELTEADWAQLQSTAHTLREKVREEIGLFSDLLESSEQAVTALNESQVTRWKAAYDYLVEERTELPAQFAAATERSLEQTYLVWQSGSRRLKPVERVLLQTPRSVPAWLLNCIADPLQAREIPEPEDSADRLATWASFAGRFQAMHAALFRPHHPEIKDPLQRPLLRSSWQNNTMELVLRMLPILGQHPESGAAWFEQAVLTDSGEQTEALHESLEQLEHHLGHFVSHHNVPHSLSIEPALYAYRDEFQTFDIELLEAFVGWMLQGDRQAIFHRKLLFSLYRESFELILQHFHSSIWRLAQRGVGAPISWLRLWFQEIVRQLQKRHADAVQLAEAEPTPHAFLTQILNTVAQENPLLLGLVPTAEREFPFGNPAESLHARPVFYKLIRCEICGGTLELLQNTAPNYRLESFLSQDMIGETPLLMHPFCSQNKQRLVDMLIGRKTLALPALSG